MTRKLIALPAPHHSGLIGHAVTVIVQPGGLAEDVATGAGFGFVESAQQTLAHGQTIEQRIRKSRTAVRCPSQFVGADRSDHHATGFADALLWIDKAAGIACFHQNGDSDARRGAFQLGQPLIERLGREPFVLWVIQIEQIVAAMINQVKGERLLWPHFVDSPLRDRRANLPLVGQALDIGLSITVRIRVLIGCQVANAFGG